MNDEKKDAITSEETFFGNEPVIISEEEAREFLGEDPLIEFSHPDRDNDRDRVNNEDDVDQKEQVSSSIQSDTIETNDISLKMEEVNDFEENEKLLEATATIPTSAILEHVSTLTKESPKEEVNLQQEVLEENITSNDENEKAINPELVAETTSIEQNMEKKVPEMDQELMKSLEKVETSPIVTSESVLAEQADKPVEIAPQAETAQTVTEKVEVNVKKRRRPFVILLNILATLFFLFVLFEVVIAFLNFNLIKQKKEPSYFATKSVETRGEFDYTIYDMGLFKIVRKEDQKEYSIKLLPFFLDY